MSQDSSAIATQLDSLIQSEELSYSPQWQPSPHLPKKPLVMPLTEKSFGQVSAIAHQNQWSLFPCGNGSKASWGGLPSDFDFYLSTCNLNQIIDHAVGDLTVTVQAGTTLASLQQQLQQAGQFLPIDPSYPESATIGGIVATADAGSWRERYGGIRDLIIGISFVRADGEIAKAGGRVVKNVAGYDLMKLFTGSYGTLGIITQLTFRTYPLPPASETLVLTGNSEKIHQVAQTLRHATLTPTRADLLSAGIVNKLNLGKGVGLILRFETISESIEKQIKELTAISDSLDLQSTRFRDDNEKSLWEQLKPLIFSPPSENGMTCKCGLLPTAAIELFQQLPSDSYAIIHNKSGLGKLAFQGDIALSDLKNIRHCCEENKGFLTILEAPTSIKKQIDPWGYSGNALTMMKKIKEQFDPQKQFSPNCFVGGI
ncbi:MAG: FAD-binding oxidoreductase [Halothece sp.]